VDGTNLNNTIVGCKFEGQFLSRWEHWPAAVGKTARVDPQKPHPPLSPGGHMPASDPSWPNAVRLRQAKFRKKFAWNGKNIQSIILCEKTGAPMPWDTRASAKMGAVDPSEGKGVGQGGPALGGEPRIQTEFKKTYERNRVNFAGQRTGPGAGVCAKMPGNISKRSKKR